MNKYFILLLVYYLLPFSSYSQTEAKKSSLCTLCGVIKDTSGAPIDFCTVTLLRAADTTFITGCISENDGRFSLKAIQEGDYQLVFSHVSYEQYVWPVHLPSDQKSETIILKNKLVSMDEVVVKGDFIKQSSNGYSVEMQGNPIAKGKTIMETLPFLPGVTNYKELKVNGLEVQAIYLNGRLLNRRDELSSLRAEDVKNIEVIPVAGAGNGSSLGSIIKIKMKQIPDHTYYGSLQSGFSFTSDGKQHPTANGIINYRWKKWNFYNNLGYSYNKNYFYNESRTDYLTQNLIQYSVSKGRPENQDFNNSLSVVYEINDNHSLGVNFSYYRSDSKGKGNSSSQSEDYDKKLYEKSDGTTNTSSEGNAYLVSLDYLGELDKKGSNVSMKWNYVNNSGGYSGDYIYHYYYTDYDSTNNARSDGNNSDYSLTGEIKFGIKIREHSTLEFGGHYSYNKKNNFIHYENEQAGNWFGDSLKSDRYMSEMRSYDGYIEWDSRFGKWSYTAGASLEDYYNSRTSLVRNTRLSRKKLKCSPFLSLTYFLDESKGTLLTSTYRRFINVPAAGFLDPREIKNSEYSYRIGNPDLKNQKMNFLQIGFTWRNKLTFAYNMKNDMDYIAYKTYVNDKNPLVTYEKPENIGKQYTHTFEVEYPIRIAKWWLFKPHLEYSYYSYSTPGYHYKSNWVIIPVVNSFTFPKNFGGSLTFNYESWQKTEDDFVYPAIYNLDLSTYKFVCSRKLQIGFSIDNLLSNIVTTSHKPDNTYHHYSRDIFSYRRYSFSLRYIFKGGKEKQVRVINADRQILEDY